MTQVIRIRQRGWIAGRGVGLEEEEIRSDISAAERHRKPSTAPSHPIKSIPAHPPPRRLYLNNNRCSLATLLPFPSVHQTSIDWVHLVPCDASSQTLIYREINGLRNNKGLNALISTKPHPPTTITMQLTNGEPRTGRCAQPRYAAPGRWL